MELRCANNCPNCEFEKEETMPVDVCRFFNEYTKCKTLIKLKPGECCVFCPYRSGKCPPKQNDCC
ncbi:MAG: GDCCVxC domain-containing (seleno)protein [Thermodesulfobacteriota bacterium]